MNEPKISRVTAVLLALSAIAAGGAQAQAPGPAYLDAAQPLDRRVDDLVSRMTLEEKASQLVNTTRAIPRLGVPEYNLWSEALHGVANNGIATVFPQAIGLAATFDAPLVKRMAEATALEARVKFEPREPRGPRRADLPGAHLLLAEHQHLPRPALGPRAGDLRGGPVPDGQARRRVHHGPAGQRPRSPGGHRHRQALRGSQRPRAAAPRLRREGLPPRHRGHVPAGVPRRRRRLGRVKSVMCVYNAINGVPGCANEFLLDGTLRAAVEVRRLRHRRLRRREGHRDRPQVREDRGRGRRRRDQGRARQRLHDRRLPPAVGAAGLPALRRRREAGAAARGGRRRRAEADAAHALRARAVRPKGADEGRAGARLGARQPRAPSDRAPARARVDGAAEERRPAAVREEAGADRRRRSARGLGPRAARQLQRLPVALDDGARRHPAAVPAGARRVRAGHEVPSAEPAGARLRR